RIRLLGIEAGRSERLESAPCIARTHQQVDVGTAARSAEERGGETSDQHVGNLELLERRDRLAEHAPEAARGAAVEATIPRAPGEPRPFQFLQFSMHA